MLMSIQFYHFINLSIFVETWIFINISLGKVALFSLFVVTQLIWGRLFLISTLLLILVEISLNLFVGHIFSIIKIGFVLVMSNQISKVWCFLAVNSVPSLIFHPQRYSFPWLCLFHLIDIRKQIIWLDWLFFIIIVNNLFLNIYWVIWGK